ncbi:MAG TPA: tetratricopeptide repeat protein [Thermoanaerobaculia bacterium]|nr:tetratricopeptide repeat protein [Thermoanaerobaculia bacterium]
MTAVAPLPPSRWEELFDELSELPPEDRARRLAELEAEDPALAIRLARLLAADGQTAEFLIRPAAELIDAGEEGPVVTASLPAGTRIGSWCLLGLLGRGGMGEVYIAEREEGTFTQRAALKLIKRGMDSQAIVQRFVRERQILSRLEHPGIARLLDGGSAADGRPFFVMERVEGVPITDYCRNRGLGLDARLRLLRDVCAAIDSAHRRLVVHRDLKPANILVTEEGAIKLLDFGIAKLLAGDEDEESTHLTQLEARVLTPAYAAPEQILGQPITTATDVYALGVLLFELVTGALPHTRERRSLGSLADAVVRETVERPSAVLKRIATGDAPRVARRVTGDLDLIVLTALHRDPARRYLSAAALSDDLGRFLADRPIRARPDSSGYRLRKFVGRNRLPVAVATLGLVALLAGLGMALWEAHEARLSARRANSEAARVERVKSFLLSVFRESDPNQAEGGAVSAGELIERGARRIDVELAHDPLMQAEMLDSLARIEDSLSLFDPALAHAKRALALREALLPREGARIADSRVLLGDTVYQRGDIDAARPILDKALAETLAARGPDSLEVAHARRSLSMTLHRPEDRARGVALLRQSLATFRRLLGDSNIETADTLLELGGQLEAEGQYGESLQAYRQALARLEHALGPRHPKVAIAQEKLGGMLDRLSRPDEARKLLEAAIATQRATLGPHHRDLAETLFSYGLLLIGRQELKAADAALSEALSIFGPNRYEAAHCLRYLGLSAMDQERFQDAADLFTRAADTFERTMGANDIERWRVLANLGWAHLKLGQSQRARQELTLAVSRIEQIAGPESYEIRLPLVELGEVLERANAHSEAIVAIDRVRRLEEKIYGTTQHVEVAGSDFLLAQSRIARGAAGDRQAARHSLDEALSILLRVTPKDLLTGRVLLESGQLALTEGNYPRARRELTAAEPLLLAYIPPTHEKVRRLHQALKELGEKEKAAAGPQEGSPKVLPVGPA